MPAFIIGVQFRETKTTHDFTEVVVTDSIVRAEIVKDKKTLVTAQNKKLPFWSENLAPLGPCWTSENI